MHVQLTGYKMVGKSVAKYPWDRWFRQQQFTLVRGVDYTCQPHGMAVLVRNTAGHRGLRVSVKINEGVITVRRL